MPLGQIPIIVIPTTIGGNTDALYCLEAEYLTPTLDAEYFNFGFTAEYITYEMNAEQITMNLTAEYITYTFEAEKVDC